MRCSTQVLRIGAMQDVNFKRADRRWIYGFDSFEGIPLASKYDDVQPGIGANPNVPYSKNTRDLLKRFRCYCT
jgi:hypothetical protein